GGEQADPLVALVEQVEVAVRVEHAAGGLVEAGVRIADRAAVAGEASTATDDDDRLAGLGVVAAELVVVPRDQEQGATWLFEQLSGVVEVDLGAIRARGAEVRQVEGAVADEVGAEHGLEVAVVGEQADLVVVPVEDVELTGAGDGDVGGPVEASGGQGLVVAV